MHVLPKYTIVAAVVSFCCVFSTEASDFTTDGYGYSGCYAHLCNTTSNYPYEKIKEAIAKYPEYNIYFGTILTVPNNRYPREINDENSPVCKERIVTMLPQVGVDISKKVVTIINTDELRQEVRYIICESSECGQKFKLTELVALDGENGFRKARVSVPFGCRLLPRKDGVGEGNNNL